MSASKNTASEAVKAEPWPNAERHMQILKCALEISGLAEAIAALADEEACLKIEALLRCYRMRIATLNELVIASALTEAMEEAQTMNLLPPTRHADANGQPVYSLKQIANQLGVFVQELEALHFCFHHEAGLVHAGPVFPMQ